jgi:hypothetical protein
MEIIKHIKEMEQFLGIKTKWNTRYKAACDFRSGPNENEWLEREHIRLVAECKKKLVASFYDDLGNNLFKEKFSGWQEHQKDCK